MKNTMGRESDLEPLKEQPAQKAVNQSRLNILCVLVCSFPAEICDNSFIDTINDQWWKWLKTKTTQSDNFIEKLFFKCANKSVNTHATKKKYYKWPTLIRICTNTNTDSYSASQKHNNFKRINFVRHMINVYQQRQCMCERV